MSEQAERVAKGVQLMDAKDSKWREMIKTSSLDMEDGGFCILGQYEGDYLRALDAWGLSYQDAYEHGFTVLTEEQYLDTDVRPTYAEWASLGEDWKREISKQK